MRDPIFGAHAMAMLRRGIAVVPIGPDRHPHVSGFQNWRRRPGASTISRWVKAYPEANIGVLPGLCGRGAIVADCDAMEHAEVFQDRFGKTDMRVRTYRGFHLWYGGVEERLPGNLRKYGLEVDFKTGRQIAIAPPSIHETGHIYQFDGCDWGALERLRPVNIEALHQFMGKARPTKAERPAVTAGRRATTLNARLIPRAFECGELDELLDLAHAYNSEFLPALDSPEVVKIATKVWRDKAEGKIEEWKGIASMRKRSRIEVSSLCQADPSTVQTHTVFCRCCAMSTRHVAAGESFQITPHAMARRSSNARVDAREVRNITRPFDRGWFDQVRARFQAQSSRGPPCGSIQLVERGGRGAGE